MSAEELASLLYAAVSAADLEQVDALLRRAGARPNVRLAAASPKAKEKGLQISAKEGRGGEVAASPSARSAVHIACCQAVRRGRPPRAPPVVSRKFWGAPAGDEEALEGRWRGRWLTFKL